jgi:hypothetical protein
VRSPNVDVSFLLCSLVITVLFSTYRNISRGINRVTVTCPFFRGMTLRHCVSASGPFATNVAVATFKDSVFRLGHFDISPVLFTTG